MARDVTLRVTYADLVGDESYELWLQHVPDAWALEDTGDVDPDIDQHQDFLLPILVSGDDYVAQFRLKRAGRYRTGYVLSNPDAWPAASRLEFTPGALVGVDAPTIVSATWSRTSSVATKIAVVITPDDAAIDLHVLRDGAIIGTIAAPHVGDVTFNDNDPELAVVHTYTAAHTAGFLDGPLSVSVDCFAGPLPPTALARTSADDSFGKYTCTWESGSTTVRFQDDFLCDTIYATYHVGTEEIFERQIETAEIPDHGVQRAHFHARVRREITAFTVTDVSDWITLNVECDIYDDNLDFHSCP
jgi:hypothetical protein